MYSFEPFIGPLPLRFGMRPDEVASLIGAPDQVFFDPTEGRSESRPGSSIGYDPRTGRLVEVVLSSGALFFHGTNLLGIANPIGFLRAYDDTPQTAVGMIFFVNLGLRLSGFHDGDESQRAISVVPQGRWDEFADDFAPFR